MRGCCESEFGEMSVGKLLNGCKSWGLSSTAGALKCVLARIGIGENEATSVIFPDGCLEVGGAVFVQSGGTCHYLNKVAERDSFS